MTRRPGAAVAAALLLFGSAAPVAAQSILSSRGLGYPLEPLDARAQGLGGVTVGLGGPHLSLVNPAAPVGIVAPGLLVTVQPDAYDATAGAVATDGSTVRFPLLMAAFPLGSRFTGSVGYGSFLDQSWQVTSEDSLDLPGTGERVGVRDRFVSDGGVARFRLGAGARLLEGLSVGLAADLFTGAANDTSRRDVDSLFSAVSATTFRYRGVGVAAGVQWSPNAALTVGAALAGGGKLNAEADTGDAATQEKSYSMPLRVDLGASARVTQNTVLALSGTWTGWSALDEDLSDRAGGAQDAFRVAGGIEYEGFTVARRVLPLRVGGRFERLPFRWGERGDDAAFPDERAVSAGLGARLAGGAARLDLAGERGWRGGGGDAVVDESFWRVSLTMSLLGR
ncbi:MAG TPA: hypothetical protein VHG91_00955 [Longimicrobium sp.]|nr:hypothetical protein [Longimicrobium sp.]